MIDPKKITDYNRSTDQLEEFLLFCVMVAGHNAHTTAKTLARVLHGCDHPFRYLNGIIKNCDRDDLENYGKVDIAFNTFLKNNSVGCYNRMAKTIRQLVSSKIDLTTCTVVDLELIHGIGPKTSRFFVTHSRPGARFAILDTHILAYMREHGIITPKSTPTGKKYADLELQFLKIVDASGMTPADFDLMIWKDRAAY